VTPLTIVEIMASAVLFTVGMIHITIWARRPGSKAHLLFALFVMGTGASWFSQIFYYRADTVDAFTVALKWNNCLDGISLVVLVWFLVFYGEGWPKRRWLPLSLSAIFVSATAATVFMPYGILYRDITGLRQVSLPWGEQIALAEGAGSPWRIFVDLAFLGLIVLVVDVGLTMWRRGRRRRAIYVCGSLLLYLVFTMSFSFLVDIGLISIPYPTSYALLLVALAMSYEMAADVVRTSMLAEKVRANEKRWRTLLENVQLLAIGVSREGHVNYANPHFTKVTDFTPEEILGRPFTDLYAPDLRDDRRHLFEDAIKGRLRASGESRLTAKGGEVRTISWSNVLLRDTQGAISGILSIGGDITERREAEEARDEALGEVEKALREGEDLKSRFEEEVVYLRNEVQHIGHFDEIIGTSDPLKYVLHRVEMVAPRDTTVLIEGETGVGKELFARAIHRLSARRKRPLVKVNCAALPANLIEAELFGHERGAFTGATRTSRGRFELADGGTLFLDEVGELPLELQAKFLRVLQEGEMERVGGDRTLEVDVRVIAATNRDLQEEVKQGRFREELYYRLHVYPITVPTLRQRKGDIPLMVQFFVQRFGKNQGKRIDQIPQPVMEELVQYDWPGNVRELENIIERAVIVTPDNTLRLAARLTKEKQDNGDVYKGPLEKVQRDYIQQILELVEWRIEGTGGAADLLKLHPNTLRFRMRKLGIERPRTQA
jgi:PAS domain S-box-containing protein